MKRNPWLKYIPIVVAATCLTSVVPIGVRAQAPVQIAQASANYNKFMRLGYAATARRDYRTALVNFRKALSVRPGDRYATTAISNVSRYARRGNSTKLAYIAPNRGAPGTRQGGATRGGCSTSDQKLTALVPQNNIGMTTAQLPTIFFYIPQTSADVLEFSLLDENDNEVYQKNLTPSKAGGIASVDLSTLQGIQPLQVNKKYHWYLSIVCNTEDRSADIFVDGWVQTVESDPALASELQQASPSDRASLYAVNGLWYDSVAALFETRKSSPNNPEIATQWADLLDSVGLGEIAKEPLIPCCTATN